MKKRTQARVSVKPEPTEGSAVKSSRTKLTRQSSLENWVKKSSDSKSFLKVESHKRFKAETPTESKVSSKIPVISLEDTDEESFLLDSSSKCIALTSTLVTPTKLESISPKTIFLKKTHTAQFTDDDFCQPSASFHLINETSDDDFESVPSWKINKKNNYIFSGALNYKKDSPKILSNQIRKKASSIEQISTKVKEENRVFKEPPEKDNFLGGKFSKKATVRCEESKPKSLKASLLSLKSQASNSKPRKLLDMSTQSDTTVFLKSEHNSENSYQHEISGSYSPINDCNSAFSTKKNSDNNEIAYYDNQSLAEVLFSDSDEVDEPDYLNMNEAHTFLKPKDELSSDLLGQSESLSILPETTDLDFHSADDSIVQMFRQQFMSGKPTRKRRIFSDCQEEEILVVDMDRTRIMKAPSESKKRPATKKRGGRIQKAQSQENTLSTNDTSSSRPTLKQLYMRAKANGRYNKMLYASLKKEYGYNNVKKSRSRRKGKSKKRKT